MKQNSGLDRLDWTALFGTDVFVAACLLELAYGGRAVRFRWRLLLLAFVGFVVSVIAGGCRNPTQVTLSIESNARCNDLKGIDIIVGADPSQAEGRATTRFSSTSTSLCAPRGNGDGGHVGTLVVTPGDGEEGGAVLVIAGFVKPASSCVPPLYQGCIVARRTFTFIAHTSLRLPIVLDPSCVDVPCNELSTCSKDRQCVSSGVRCEESGTCGDPGSGPNGEPIIVDAGRPIPPIGPTSNDASTTPDGTTSLDGSVDSGPTFDGGPFPPLPTTATPFGACAAFVTCPSFVSCNAQAPCCYVPPASGSPECEMRGVCDGMGGSTSCCLNAGNCPGQFCCAKRNPAKGSVHIACAAHADCIGDAPPAFACSFPSVNNPEQCPPEMPRCTGVSIHGSIPIFRCGPL